MPAVEQPPRRRWFRRPEDRALTSATVPAIFLPRASNGEPVTTRNALRLVDVWACVRTLAQTAATLPLHSYRRTDQGRERVVNAEYLTNPAPGVPQGLFVAQMVASLALHGEAFVGKFRDASDDIRMVSLLDPDLVGVEVGPDGEPVFTTVNALSEPIVLFRRDVVHIRLMSLDGVRGVSPIAQCRDALGLSASLARHADEAAGGGYRPDGIVTVAEGPGAEDVAENLRQKWSERHSKPGRTAFVTSALSYTPISLPARDVEFIAQRSMSTVEVCRVFGIPPWMIGATSGDSMTYSNVESQSLAFAKFAMQPYTRAIEQSLTLDRELMPPGDTFCEFLYDSLLRPDSATRAQVYTAALDPEKGWLTRAEVRELENYPTEGTT